MLDTLFKHETESLRVEDEKTDFQLIHQKVQGMFTKSDMEIELKVLDTLKERLEQKQEDSGTEQSEEQALEQTMKKIEEVSKLESNQQSTVGLMGKLLSKTKSKKECFLCKQGVNGTQIDTMSKNFPIAESKEKYEQQIVQMRQHLSEHLKQLIQSGTKSNSVKEALEVIEEFRQNIMRKQKVQKQVDHQSLNHMLFQLQLKATNIQQQKFELSDKAQAEYQEQEHSMVQTKVTSQERKLEQLQKQSRGLEEKITTYV